MEKRIDRVELGRYTSTRYQQMRRILNEVVDRLNMQAHDEEFAKRVKERQNCYDAGVKDGKRQNSKPRKS